MSEPIGMMRMGMAMASLAMLAACGEQSSLPSQDKVQAVQGAAPVDDGKAECALNGSGDWARDCRVERVGKMLTIRHPDGGFRRFRVLEDGRGLESADGAEAAKLTILDDRRIEVVSGEDRYQLSARIGGVGE
jgi:hypothetical protein